MLSKVALFLSFSPLSLAEFLTQYVRGVVNYSSQYSATRWSANQIIGAPDIYPQYGEISRAWATAQPDSPAAIEWIIVEVYYPVYLVAVTIYETYNPGAVYGFSVWTGDDWLRVWENPHIGPQPSEANAFIPFFNLIPTAVLSKYYRLEIDSYDVPGYNEIDALKIGGYYPYCSPLPSPPALCTGTEPDSLCHFYCPLGYHFNPISLVQASTIAECNILGVWNLSGIENVTLETVCIEDSADISCTTFEDTNFVGIPFQKLEDVDPYECCSRCESSSDCLIWTYNTSNSECKLLDERVSSLPSPAITSGVVASRLCTTCTGGSFCNTSIPSVCLPCPAGTYGIGGVCLPCSDPHSTSLPGTSSCFCNDGYAGDGTTCTPCPAGTYGQRGVCNQCLDPNAESSVGSTSCHCKSGYAGNGYICSPCPKDTYSYLNNTYSTCHPCSACPAGFFSSSNCSWSNDTVCQLCQVCKADEDEAQPCGKWGDSSCVAKSWGVVNFVSASYSFEPTTMKRMEVVRTGGSYGRTSVTFRPNLPSIPDGVVTWENSEDGIRFFSIETWIDAKTKYLKIQMINVSGNAQIGQVNVTNITITSSLAPKVDTDAAAHRSLSLAIVLGLIIGGIALMLCLVVAYYWRKSLSEWILVKAGRFRFTPLVNQTDSQDLELEKPPQSDVELPTGQLESVANTLRETKDQSSDSQGN